QEFKFDGQRPGVLVDQLARVLRSPAMVAKERVRDRVEDGGLARAVEAREHPERRALERDFLLLLVAEKPTEANAMRDHGRGSPTRVKGGWVPADPPTRATRLAVPGSPTVLHRCGWLVRTSRPPSPSPRPPSLDWTPRRALALVRARPPPSSRGCSTGERS